MGNRTIAASSPSGETERSEGKKMHKYRIVLVWLSFVAVASAQNSYPKYYYPKKDMPRFGQVVVGGGFETIINIANRGSHRI